MKPTDSMYQVQDLEEDLLCSKTLLGQEIIAIQYTMNATKPLLLIVRRSGLCGMEDGNDNVLYKNLKINGQLHKYSVIICQILRST